MDERYLLLLIFGPLWIVSIIIIAIVHLVRKSKSVPSTDESYFDGTLLSYIGWSILGFFVTVLTLGICFPWALCMVYGWKINHTVINGHRLKFTGNLLEVQ